ncbi:MAG: hypothetical protein NVSMB6_09710 [Burkholderiaceae bacterium]
MRKKLAIVCFTGDSGLTDYSVSLSKALMAHADVELLTSNRLLPRFSAMGFKTTLVFRRSRHYIFDLPKLILHLLRTRPDCVLLQGPLKVPLLECLMVRLLRRRGVCVAVTIHDVLPHYPRPWSRLEFGMFYRRFDRVVVHSQAAAIAVAALGVSSDILTVPHDTYHLFCLTRVSRSQARARIDGLMPEDFVVLFFGTLEPRKGLIEFLTVAKQCEHTPGLKFLIAGSSQLLSRNTPMAEALAGASHLANVVIHDRRVPF